MSLKRGFKSAAGPGAARHGSAGIGWARPGKARNGQHGIEYLCCPPTRRGRPGPGGARPGGARPGGARLGGAGQGMETGKRAPTKTRSFLRRMERRG